jgi:hypothetical protein
MKIWIWRFINLKFKTENKKRDWNSNLGMIWNWNKKWWNQKKRKREKTTWADSSTLGPALYSLGPPPHLFRTARFPFSRHHQPIFYCWRRRTRATGQPHSLVMLMTLIGGAHCQLVRPPRNRARTLYAATNPAVFRGHSIWCLRSKPFGLTHPWDYIIQSAP